MKSAAELMDRVSFLNAMDELAATWRSKRASAIEKQTALSAVLVMASGKLDKDNPAPLQITQPPPLLAPSTKDGVTLYNTPEEAGITFDPFHDPLEPVEEPANPTSAEIVAAQTAELATRLEGKSGAVSVWMNDDFMASEAGKMAEALGWSMTAPPEPCAATARLHGGPSSGWRIKLHR